MDISTNRLLFLAHQGAAHLVQEYQTSAFAAQRSGNYAKASGYFYLARNVYAEQQSLFDLLYGDPTITDTTDTIDNSELAEFLREE